MPVRCFSVNHRLSRLRPLLKDLKHAGDWMFYLYLLQDGWICFVPESLNHHRRHSQSITLGAKSLNLFREILRVQMFWMQKIPVDAQTESVIEQVRQSTYMTLGLHTDAHGDYRDHPGLADILGPQRLRYVDNLPAEAVFGPRLKSGTI